MNTYINTFRSLSLEEITLIGGGEADSQFFGIAPGGCVIYPPKVPAKPRSPSDDTND